MRIRAAEVFKVSIPFRFGFKHAGAERNRGDSVILRLEDGEGCSGFGECAPRTYVSGESSETVAAVLAGRLLPPFLNTRFSTFQDVVAALRTAAGSLPRDQHAAFCALELALLDLAGKVFGCSAGEVVGPVE